LGLGHGSSATPFQAAAYASAQTAVEGLCHACDLPNSKPSLGTVAIFDASDDAVEMLKEILSLRGYRTVSGEGDHVKAGTLDFIAFMGAQRPDAIIWDIAPPYDRNWNFFKLWRNAGVLQNCYVVVTTTNKKQLDSLAGQETGAIEIVGKPYDLETIADAVQRGFEGGGGSEVRQFKARE
jgi:CheY-like chemotaxis protein